ncbi:retention module-containing protein [Paraglaciecola aestuariivivens]
MQNLTTSKLAKVVEVNGQVQLDSEQNLVIQAGQSLDFGATLRFEKGSQVTLAFEDGTVQKISAPASEHDSELSVETLANNVNFDALDEIQDDIAAIQALIESGEEVELPDTAAGGLQGNEGTSFVTLSRDGDELLAQAGYDTTGIDNPNTTNEQPELAARTAQPTITQSDFNTIPEDTIATGNVLDNDSDLDDELTVQSFTVEGDSTVYLAGQTALVEGGNIVLNQDGSYTFTPDENFNGLVPVVTYTTNTNASDTLTIEVTPVSDLVDDNESVTTAEDTSVSGNVLTNASSSDGTPVITSFVVGGVTYSAGATANLTEGDLTLNANGSFTFVPAANYNGAVPVTTYTVSDGVNTDISTLSINVTPESDLVDGDESVTTAEDTSVSGNVLTNASSADGTPVITSFVVGGLTYSAGATANLTEGDLTLNANGSFTFVPAANYNGAVPVTTYTVSDGVNTDSSTLSISVTPESDLVDGDESVTTAEDTSVSGNVLANASSADGTPVITSFVVGGVTYSAGTTAKLTEGDLTLNANGSFTFVPAANYNGAVPVTTYTVSDGVNTDSSTLSISVTPESDLTDGDESVTTAEDTSVSGNVLANASSADGTPVITSFVVGGVTYSAGDTANLTEGDLTLNANGSFTFVPAANYNGAVPVTTYTVSDGVNTDSSTLSISVTPESDLTDGDESVTTAEDTSVSGNVLTNASSADGTPVITSFVVGGVTYSAGATAKLTEGDLTLNANGSFTFVPATNYNGAVPVTTYTVSDGVNTDSSTLSISVTPESDLTDGDESVTTAEDTSVSGNVLANASSADGTPVITSFVVGGVTYSAGATANLTEGDLTLNANGSFTFVPAANYNGAVPVTTYTVSDGVNTDSSTLSISVTPESDLTDGDESVTTAEDTSVSGNVLSNASSADGTPVITSFVVGGVTYSAGATANLTEGDLTLNANGSFTFVPAANYNGAVPVATYTVSDSVNTDTSTLSINVTPESDLTDGDESVTTAEDTSVSGNALSNASSADGTPVITSFVVGGVTYSAGATANLTEGDLTLNANGSFTFVPAANYNGAVPVATYTVSDSINTDTSTLSINVTPESDLTDGDESVTTAEDTSVSGNVLSNASSADGTPVITSFVVGGVTYSAGATANLTEGDLTLNANGSFTFVPAANYNGVVPVATYTVSDSVNTDTSTLSINVTPESDLTDGDESVTTAEDTSVSGNVLANASSADGTAVITGFVVGGLTYSAGATANLTEGDLTLNANGSFTFVPAANYNGVVPVTTYTVSDGVNTDSSTLSINVTPESDLVDGDESVTTAEDTSVSGNVLTNASSADGTPVITSFVVGGVTYSAGATANLTEGDLTLNANGNFTFVPAANYNGAVPVTTYTVSDSVNTDTSTLSINVTPESDLTDGDESVTTAEDTSVSGNVLSNASSADGTPVITSFVVGGLTYSAGATANLTEGDLTLIANGSFTFVPAANYNGAVPVTTYTVSDGVNTDSSTLSIEVTPGNNPPVAADDNFTVNEGESVSGNLITHDDGDGVSDSDGGDGGTLKVTEVNGVPLVFDSVTGIATVAIKDGTLSIKEDGSYTYQNDGFVLGSAAPTFTYTLSDGTDVDTATVTINVVDAAPDARDDFNYISLNEAYGSGKAFTSIARGNVIKNGSTGDRADVSADGFGTPIITQVVYDGKVYEFTDTVTSHSIETEYGTLTISSSGAYNFTTPFGMVIPSAEVNLKFSYTVQDADNQSPEEDSAILTINIKPPSTASKEVPIDVEDLSSTATIDTSFENKNLSHADEEAFEYAPDTDHDGLNDILIDSNTGGLEEYLAMLGELDKAMQNDDSQNESAQPIDEQVLMSKENPAQNAQSKIINNELLEDGALIVSDTLANGNNTHAELDSPDLL